MIAFAIHESLIRAGRVFAQECVYPCLNLCLMSEQQMSSGRQRHKLGTWDVLRGVLAEGEGVYAVISGVNY